MASCPARAGHRYNKGTGVLRLVSTKYRDREDNRRDIMRIISGAPQLRGARNESAAAVPNCMQRSADVSN